MRDLCNTMMLLGAVILGPAGAAAQTLADIDSCAQIVDDRERLACFDRAAALRKERRQSAEPAAIAATPQPAPRLSPEQAMGLPPGKILELEKPSDVGGLKELTATIQGVSTNPSGRKVFTLDNGQVWQQVAPDPKFTVQPGNTVRITKGVLGSFFMSASTHVNTRVSRAR